MLAGRLSGSESPPVLRLPMGGYSGAGVRPAPTGEPPVDERA